MKCTLYKRESNHANLRTEVVEGAWGFEPTVGASFIMFSKSLDPAKDVRMIQTSTVQKVERDGNTWNFETLNSKYTVVSEEES